ncbi:MAG: SdiA-regulated domain-containing protein [Planctomycetota bacterium]|nr:SdiA-regulated domain-containing protein [Planctomycetota bacterium]
MKTRDKTVAALAAIAVLASAAFTLADGSLHFPSRTLFHFREWRHAQEWKDRSLWLPDYRATLDALAIEGVDGNLSGLTWNGDTKTLFAVVNRPARIVELSTGGETLRMIDLFGFDDPEALEYIGDGRFIVADERVQRLVSVDIGPETREIRAEGLQRLAIGQGAGGNKGLEGLAWDPVNGKLYVAKERAPVRIYEITGFPHDPNMTLDIEVTGNRTRDDRLFVSDISGLYFNRQYRHLLALSHESRLVIEVDESGCPISSLSLAGGQGLSQSIPQAEGIAMDDRNNLYVVSEPNLFYVFRKKTGE